MQPHNADETAPQIGPTPNRVLYVDQEVLGQVFSRYTSQLYRIAFRFLGSREDAEDAVQDGLLAATRNLRSFEGRAQFSTWLTRVVVNAALMRRRKLRGHVFTSIDQQNPDEPGLSLASRIADPHPDPEEAYARKEQRTIMKQWLEALPPSYRSALWLRDIEGMTTEEAAEALGLSTGTLKSRLHRARLQFSRRVHEGPHGRTRPSRVSCKRSAMPKAPGSNEQAI